MSHIELSHWITEYTQVGVRILIKRALNAKGIHYSESETTENLVKIACLVDAEVEKECAHWASVANRRREVEDEFPPEFGALMIRQAAVAANLFYRQQEKERGHV